jgi:hypothetical protein
LTKDATQEEKDRVYQRSLAYRQAEKDLQGAVGGGGEAKARAAHKEARSRWRDAADRAMRKPP